MQPSESDYKYKSTLKITILTTSFPRFKNDSAGIFIYNFASQLSKLSCSFNVVAPHDTEVKPQDYPDNLNIHFFKYFYPLKYQSFAYKGGIVNRIKKKWLRILQLPFFMISFLLMALKVSRKSDIIHSYWSVAGLIALTIKAINKTPVILTIWGSDILFTKIPVFSYFYRLFLKQANFILCESQHFKDQLVDFGIPEILISVIAYGIDYDTFKPSDKLECRKKLGLPAGNFIILSVGNLIKLKGYNFLIDAIPKFLTRHPNAHFILVGDGENRIQLEIQAKKLDVYNNLQFVGQQHASEIPGWLNSADIFVHPSLSEGTPNSIIEAMACGLPVLATAVGDIPNIIDSGHDGILIPSKDYKQIEIKLDTLIQSEKLRNQYSQNGFKKVRSKFGNWETQAQLLFNLYHKALAVS